MNPTITVYFVYLLVSLGLTIWVAKTLHKNGHLFLVEAFHGDEDKAKAVNHLLVVGFYLVNLGFVLLFLSVGKPPEDMISGIEYTATKIGVVLLVLGGMHFFNMFNFDRMRRKAKASSQSNPPPPPARSGFSHPLGG